MSPLDRLRNLKGLFDRAARETSEIKGVAESTRDDYDAIGNFEAWITDKERRRAPRLSVERYSSAQNDRYRGEKAADAFRIEGAAKCERVGESRSAFSTGSRGCGSCCALPIVSISRLGRRFEYRFNYLRGSKIAISSGRWAIIANASGPSTGKTPILVEYSIENIEKIAIILENST